MYLGQVNLTRVESLHLGFVDLRPRRARLCGNLTAAKH